MIEIKRADTKIRIYESVNNSVPEQYRDFVDMQLAALRELDKAYRLQEEEPPIPTDVNARELFRAAAYDQDILSPYTKLEKRGPRGELRSLDYMEDHRYRDIFHTTAYWLEEAAGVAWRDSLPDRYLIGQSLGIQAGAFRGGNFKEARAELLNVHQYPTYAFDGGFLDRYNCPYGVKFSIQGLITTEDKGKTAKFNTFVHLALGDSGISRNYRLIMVDALALGGLAADHPWSANTIPSEDDLRHRVGAVTVSADNVADEKFQSRIKPSLVKHFPEVEKGAVWENTARDGHRLNIVMHEAGHAAIGELDERIDYEEKTHYTTFKEAACEAWGNRGTLNLPEDVMEHLGVCANAQELAIKISCSWSMYDIETFLQLPVDQRSRVILVYAQAGAINLNSYITRKVLQYNVENGQIKIEDIDAFKTATRQRVAEQESVLETTKYRPGYLRRWVDRNIRYPVDFLNP